MTKDEILSQVEAFQAERDRLYRRVQDMSKADMWETESAMKKINGINIEVKACFRELERRELTETSEKAQAEYRKIKG